MSKHIFDEGKELHLQLCGNVNSGPGYIVLLANTEASKCTDSLWRVPQSVVMASDVKKTLTDFGILDA